MSGTRRSLAPVVAVLNMKGGVGKTTISAHVFKHLFARLRKSVLLVDFDPQFNLTQTIVPQLTYERLKQEGKTILRVMEPAASTSIFNVTTAVGPPPEESEVTLRVKRFSNSEVSLGLVPGDFGLLKYSLVEDAKSLAPIRRRFLKFIENCQADRDLICIDCNPSSSFMTVCAVLASTHIVVPVRPDRYSVLGLQLLNDFLDHHLPGLTPKPKIIVLLNGIPTQNYDPTVENSLRGNPTFGPMTLVNVLHTSKILSASPSYTGFATDKRVPHRTALSARISLLVDELGRELGLS